MGLNWSSNVAHHGFKNVIGNTKRLTIRGADMGFQVRDSINDFANKTWDQWPSWTCHRTQTSGKSTLRWSSISFLELTVLRFLFSTKFSRFHYRTIRGSSIGMGFEKPLAPISEHLVTSSSIDSGNRKVWQPLQPTEIFRFQFSMHSSTAQPLSKIHFSLRQYLSCSPWPLTCSTIPEERHGHQSHNSEKPSMPQPSKFHILKD